MMCVRPSGVIRNRRWLSMDSPTREHVRYDHTDDCRHLRWDARESYEFMYYSRPWPSVLSFYATLVAHSSSPPLASLFGGLAHDLCHEVGDSGEDSKGKGKGKGRWGRATFKVLLAYDGSSFDGWQKQPSLNTVQSSVESCLAKFGEEDKKGVALCVAGRTDKGVTALRQVCSFFSWRKDIHCKDIQEAINAAAPGKLTVESVTQVSRSFHPNFSAKWRRYVYIFPMDTEEGADVKMNGKPTEFSVERVNRLLQKLEGKLLSYKMFARDTKPSRNTGPPTECFMYHARAAEGRLPPVSEGTRVMCVELVANRFLRRMVRVVVATAMREAAAGAEEDALLKLMDATCRRATAPPAPPEGLCLADVGYSHFNPRFCLIPKY